MSEINVKELQAERDALAAKLAELEGQEPVAFGNRDELDDILADRHCLVTGVRGGFHRTPLYARPVPAEQPVNAQLLESLSELLDDIEALIGESSGVYGLHLNGDVSPWSELEEGGRFERLSSMSSAREAVSAAEAAPKAVLLSRGEINRILWRDSRGHPGIGTPIVDKVEFARAEAVLAEAVLAEPQPDADGWIPWCPVDPSALVEVRLRDGKEFIGNEARDGSEWIWGHDGGRDDIVAYRVVEAHQ